jgi:hypothetical protein
MINTIPREINIRASNSIFRIVSRVVVFIRDGFVMEGIRRVARVQRGGKNSIPFLRNKSNSVRVVPPAPQK